MAKTVVFEEVGEAEVLKIRDLEVSPPRAGEVQLRVKAIGINRAEIMYRTGQYVIDTVFPAKLGYEASGIVEAVGYDVKHVQVGDEVGVVPAFSFLDYGLYGELVNAPARAVVKNPKGLSFVDSAASWMMFVTGYGALIEIADLQAGDAVLIRAASSSTGIAAIQICNVIGAKPIALTRKSNKRQALLDAGAAFVIATEEEDLVTEVARITNGKGARIAFDPVGGREVPKILSALATNGFFIQYGALDTGTLSIPVMELLGKHLTIRGYELFEITLDPQRLPRAIDFVTRGLESGTLKPLIATTVPFKDIVHAHRLMEANEHTGKIVVVMD